jgi:glycosyltransferase involved in cell wall biosynthesis
MVCYYFPPLGGIGSIRAARFAEYLPASGWEACVLAPANGAYYRDESIVIDPGRVRRSYSLELSRAGKRLTAAGGGDTTAARGRSWRGILQTLARRFLYWPDAQIGWLPLAIPVGRALLRERRFDAILSSSFPVTSHLIARRLSLDFGLPWIAEFRDPWAEQIGVDAATTRKRLPLERTLVRDASAVVTVSPSWERVFRERGARRAAVITNGFDPVDVSLADTPGECVLCHLGSFYPQMQDLRGAWAALAELRRAQPERRVKLRFVGEPPLDIRRQVIAAGLGDAMVVTGFIPHQEALRCLGESTALLLGGPVGTHPSLAGWIPAKLFEYLGSHLPIVYVGNLDSDAAALLAEQPSCYCLAPGDVNGIGEALARVLDAPRVTRQVERFTRRALAGKLAALLDEVVTQGCR